MRPILLFAGPSLPTPRLVLDPGIRLMPPARCGDLLRGLAHAPAAIALVDGVFEVAPTVWHKEILAVLDRGIPVYGAASLGALRAAELDRFGMIGVGKIYEAYRDGPIESDAAVMVAHAPAALGYQPLTLALVDAEASLDVSGLPASDCAMLRTIARRMNFRDRTWHAIVAAFGARAGAERAARAAAAIAASAFSQKQRDTAALIVRLVMRDGRVGSRCELPPTTFLQRLLNICAA